MFFLLTQFILPTMLIWLGIHLLLSIFENTLGDEAKAPVVEIIPTAQMLFELDHEDALLENDRFVTNIKTKNDLLIISLICVAFCASYAVYAFNTFA